MVIREGHLEQMPIKPFVWGLDSIWMFSLSSEWPELVRASMCE